MPKKTLALISGLVVVTIVLFIIALRAGQQSSAPSVPPSQQVAPTAMVPAHSVLELSPNPVTVAPGGVGSVDVMLDPSDNNVTAVQLEIGYDPHIISNVKVVPGVLFANPGLNYGKDNPTTGRYNYMLGITPSGQPVTQKGVVATITFTALPGTLGKSMQLGLLPTSLVTSRGVAESVLKSATGTVITVGNGAAATTNYNTTAPAK